MKLHSLTSEILPSCRSVPTFSLNVVVCGFYWSSLRQQGPQLVWVIADSLARWNNTLELIGGTLTAWQILFSVVLIDWDKGCRTVITAIEMLTNYSFFVLFDLIILQRPIGFLSIEISSVNIREIKLPHLPRETRLTEELSRASWLALPPRPPFLSCHSRQWQLALKYILDLVYEFPACRADARLFACPMGACLLAPLCCVFSKLRHKVNYRLDSGSTGSLMQDKQWWARQPFPSAESKTETAEFSSHLRAHDRAASSDTSSVTVSVSKLMITGTIIISSTHRVLQ